jgi:protein-disulfide isomerase-like protein with CxxC motif
VVEELHPEQLLSPVVRVIYHAGRKQYVAPVVADLAAAVGNHYGQIVRAENFSDWGLSAVRWQPV